MIKMLVRKRLNWIKLKSKKKRKVTALICNNVPLLSIYTFKIAIKK